MYRDEASVFHFGRVSIHICIHTIQFVYMTYSSFEAKACAASAPPEATCELEEFCHDAHQPLKLPTSEINSLEQNQT